MTDQQAKILAGIITLFVIGVHIWVEHGHKRHELFRKIMQWRKS